MNKNTKLTTAAIFSNDEIISHRYAIFQHTNLGRLYHSIPFFELSQLLPSKGTGSAGATPWFDNAGMLAVMFLKSFLGLSDSKLVDRINSDWELQMFCGRQFKDNQRIKDKNLPSKIRSYLGENLSLDCFQDIVIKNWVPYMEDKHCGFADATAYESYIKYPTDEKLLWDCCIWIFESIFVLFKELGIKRPVSKYREQQVKQLAFSKLKKKTYQVKKRRRKSLLYLLNKGIGQLKNILEQHQQHINLAVLIGIETKQATVCTIHHQQRYMHDNPGEYVQDRIVSLFKPYLRTPLVRVCNADDLGIAF